MKQKFYLGTGRRKTAVARVRVVEGKGEITVNGRSVDEFFTEHKDQAAIYGPLELTDMRNKLNVAIQVNGGGFTGQAGAASQGIARALQDMFGLATDQSGDGEQPVITMAKKLRDPGYLTRDGRIKERKKYGRKGARKSFQFSKR